MRLSYPYQGDPGFNDTTLERDIDEFGEMILTKSFAAYEIRPVLNIVSIQLVSIVLMAV